MASSSPRHIPRDPRKASISKVKERVGAKMSRVSDREREEEEINIPERFFNDEGEDEDADDGTGVGKDSDGAFLARQSVYGLMAATQSKANFSGQFQQDSGSESEGDEEEGSGGGRKSVDRVHKAPRGEAEDRRQRANSKLAKSVFRPVREWADSDGRDPMTQSQILQPRQQHQQQSSRPSSGRIPAPVLDRKLQAMAKARMESSTSSVSSKSQKDREFKPIEEQLPQRSAKSLPQVIANIFQFLESEDVISEYPCWYLQNVLLQGYMYITQKHVCFYAYLQKKTGTAIKSGQLGKRGKHSYSYKRYWFVLRGDTFSYYPSAAEPFSPLSMVDLRFAISAEVSEKQDKDQEATEFTITTNDRTYYYRADSASAAREWVKQLQKVIFRSHNEGDSVKISLPLENIVDIEQTGVVDFAETIKLRVFTDDQTFAIDEYFFTFFSFSEDAVGILKSLINGNDNKKALLTEDNDAQRRNLAMSKSPGSHSPFLEPVRATLSPRNAGDPANPRLRAGSDASIRHDHDHFGLDRGGDKQRIVSLSSASGMEESVESFVTSSEQPSESTNDDVMDANMSASQMLVDDTLFRGTALRRPQPTHSTAAERIRSDSTSSSREPSTEGVRIQPPSRQHTGRHHEQNGGSSDTVRGQDSKQQASHNAGPSRLVRGISTPIQHAMNVAGMVRSSSKRMSSYLGSSPKTYIDNWSAAIAGGKRHYMDTEGLAPDDSIREPELDLTVAEHEQRFRAHFGLPATEKLVATFYCWIHKTLPMYGKIYMGTRRFCFRSLVYGTKTKVVLPYKDIINVQKQRGFRWGSPGMVLVIKGHEELFFDFPSVGLRDDAVVTVLRHLETEQALAESVVLTEEEQQEAHAAATENQLLQAARKHGYANHDLQLPSELSKAAPDVPPVIFDDPDAEVLDFKPKTSLRITCLTIGSRGDVQPYIALCKGLIEEGHKPKIATHGEFKAWVEKHGIEFAEVGGNPADLMKLCVEYGTFTPRFLMEANSKFRPWLNGLLKSAWEACQDADVLIESPSAMGGIHIAEALEIPYFRAFSMPWTKTRAYPHAFSQPGAKLGGQYNYITYTLFDGLFWQMTAGQINRWRGEQLGLGPTSLDKLQQNKVPFLYNFSPHVVSPPLDFSDWIKVTGYWFLDEGDDYTPPTDLASFIKQARDDGKKLVYIGFGSVTVENSKQLLQQIIDAVEKADVRCILAKGWSDRFEKDKPGELPVEAPSCIHNIRSAPHDWLFRQVDAVVHHGGAGTTGASLRAGIPTIIRPFFGDQYFFASRVADLGVGIHLERLTSNQLGKALWIATHDARMQAKARVLGESIRGEDGVATAINALYREMNYAKSLIKSRGQSVVAQKDGAGGEGHGDGVVEDTEENWTFIEHESSESEIAEAMKMATENAAKGIRGPDSSSFSSTKGGSSNIASSLRSMVMRGGGLNT